MKRNPLTVALSMLLVAALWSPAAAQSEPSPSLSVEANRLELGEVQAGSEAVGTFVFHNNGPEDIRIIRAKPS